MAKAKSNFSFDVVKKNLFWIFVPLAVIVMWAMFFVANSKVKADYTKRMEDLNSIKEKVGTIKNNSAHPNMGTIDAAKVEEKRLREIVFRAWEAMYRDQQEYCKWSPRLGQNFVSLVENKKWLSPIPEVKQREWYNTFIELSLPEYLVKVNRRTVSVRTIDPNTGEWKKDENGEIKYISIDPFVVKPFEMMRQMTQSVDSASGMGSSSGTGGVSGSGGGTSVGSGRTTGFTTFSGMGGVSGSGGGMGGVSGSGGGMGGVSGGGGGMGGVSGGGGGMGMGELGGMTSGTGLSLDNIFDSNFQKVEGTVDWPTPEIFSIVTWSGPTPFSVQIWLAQEELWVYESMINVIARINKQVNATGPHNAAIKRINAMLIGRNAASIVGMPGILEPLGPFTGGSLSLDMGTSDSSMMSSSDSSSMMDGSSGMSGPLTEEEVKTQLMNYRYVDETMKPLASSDDPPFAEFDMMPVCLELIVDQRKIPEILIACANSTMPIDVKLVRYSPGYAQTGLLATRSGGMDSSMGMSPSGSSGSGSGGMGGGAMGGGARGGGGTGGGLESASQALSGFEVGGKIGPYGSDAVMIQIIGIIYIYNEPDPKLLATGANAQESGLEGGVEIDASDMSGSDENATGSETTTDDSGANEVSDETPVDLSEEVVEEVAEEIASEEE